MEFVVAIVALLLIGGAALAIYEKIKGRTVLEHDLSQEGPQTEADREALRANDVLIGKTMTGGMDGYH